MPEETIEYFRSYIARNRRVITVKEIQFLISDFSEHDLASGACLLFIDRFFRKLRQ